MWLASRIPALGVECRSSGLTAFRGHWPLLTSTCLQRPASHDKVLVTQTLFFHKFRGTTSDQFQEIQDKSSTSVPKLVKWRRRQKKPNNRPILVRGINDVKNNSGGLESVSVAADLLFRNDSKSGPDQSLMQTKNSVKHFAELEELAAVRIKEAYTTVEEVSEEEGGDSKPDAHLEQKSELGTSSSKLCSGKRKVVFYGTPDPSVPMSHVPCHGCGARLHCQDTGIPGYIPSQKFLATPESQLKDVICQRCHLLTTFNLAVDVAVGPSDYEAVVSQIKKKVALVIVVVDVADLPNSFYQALPSLIGGNKPIYIIGNKVDLLPKDEDGYLKRIKEALLKLCEDCGLSEAGQIKHVGLISGKTGYGVEELITKIMSDWSRKGQVYILGCTNAGKSTMFNALLSSDLCRSAARDVLHRATTSVWPGTTLNLLKFPIINPKPAVLHKRLERLMMERSNEEEEERLRLISFKESGHWKHATLMGHIGTSVSTPQEIAIQEALSRHSGGFVVPSYTFSDECPDGLEQHTGTDGLMNELKPETEPYDDSTYKYWCYDTPGLVNPEQVINLLNQEELSAVLPSKLIKPRTFVLKPGQVMFVSGLGRIDYSQGDVSIYFTVIASDRIPVHVLNKDRADDFYKAKVGTPVLGIPLGDAERMAKIPAMEGKEFTVEGLGWKESAADVILSSLGWVSVTAGTGRTVTLKAFTPGGLGCTLRTPAMLKYAVNLRGKRITESAAYRTRRHKMC